MYLEHRDSGFPWLINHKNYKIGIEIGVRDGGYSRRLLNSNIEKLFGVDRYWQREARHLPTARELEKDSRYKLYILESPAAANFWADNYFDFIHIDADHSYEGCKLDLEAWWPKLKLNGCFSGDDYILLNNPIEGEYGVIKAVEEFVKNNQLELFITGLEHCSLEQRLKFGQEQGVELQKKIRCDKHNFQQTPNWYLFKKGE